MIKLEEIDDIVFSGVDNSDYPDYSDAFVESATYKGRDMTEEEMEELMDDYRDYVYDKLMTYIF
jgi:hypothetical protein|tara:strand:+ start:6137 stop:6328 length:192 start_codon:yes stop_codon:yes gene_type:complete